MLIASRVFLIPIAATVFSAIGPLAEAKDFAAAEGPREKVGGDSPRMLVPRFKLQENGDRGRGKSRFGPGHHPPETAADSLAVRRCRVHSQEILSTLP